MSKDHTPVQWTLPAWAADLLCETIQMDAQSKAFDPALRKELACALGSITETDLTPAEISQEPKEP